MAQQLKQARSQRKPGQSRSRYRESGNTAEGSVELEDARSVSGQLREKGREDSGSKSAVAEGRWGNYRKRARIQLKEAFHESGGLKSAERGPESTPGDTVNRDAYGVTMYHVEVRRRGVGVLVCGGWCGEW